MATLFSCQDASPLTSQIILRHSRIKPANAEAMGPNSRYRSSVAAVGYSRMLKFWNAHTLCHPRRIDWGPDRSRNSLGPDRQRRSDHRRLIRRRLRLVWADAGRAHRRHWGFRLVLLARAKARGTPAGTIGFVRRRLWLPAERA